MSKDDFWMKDGTVSMARSLRYAVVQSQYRQGNLTKAQAHKLLTGPLTPGDDTTVFDDSDCFDASDRAEEEQ